jgi:hypothetical protein
MSFEYEDSGSEEDFMNRKVLIGTISVLWLYALAVAGPVGKPTLNPVQKLELLRLEETWNILDQVAAKVWPGWKGYADIPFRFEYENQTQMLVGHPNPPDEFELVEGVTVLGKKVYLDRSREVPVELVWPTYGGGGPRPFGKGDDPKGKVETIWIRLDCNRDAGKGENRYRSEDQIILYIHELFHVYQSEFYRTDDSVDNYRMNPSTNFAVYSDMEGQALLKAFQEKGKKASLEHLKDFVAARMMKFNSMTPEQQIQEKHTDFTEGTARYAEYATLLEIGKRYRPRLTSKDDPYFTGFKDPGYFFNQRLEQLKHSIGYTDGSHMKCYEYGCFQGLLLNRIAPGWQKTIPAKNRYLFDIIVKNLRMSDQELQQIKERLDARYDAKALFAKHNPPLQARDDAFKAFDDQKGRKYLIDFELTREFPFPSDYEAKSYMKTYPRDQGILRYIYPEGFKTLVVQQVQIEGKGLPLERRELYKVGFVDTKGTGHMISASKVENNVYTDAVVVTDGFTLKVPKMEIKEKDGAVIFIVLSKVKTS